MNKKNSSTASHAMILTAGTAVETVLQFVFVLVAGRELGPEGFGYYGYLVAIVTLVATIVQFGLPVTVVREVAQRPRDEAEIFAAMFRIRGVLALVFFVIAFVFYLLQPINLEHKAAAWLVFLYLLPLPFELSAVFDAKKLWRWDVPGKIAGRFVTLGLLLTLWKYDGELTLLDTALSAAVWQLFYTAISWRMAKNVGLSLAPFAPTREIRRMIHASTPIMFANVVTILSTQSQLIYVRWLTDAKQTGYYALVTRIALPLLLIKGVIYRIILPFISDVARDTVLLKPRLERLLPTLDLLFMPLACTAIVLVDIFLIPLFGPDYAGSVLPTQIILSEFFVGGSRSLYGAAVFASGNPRPQVIGLTIGCAIGLILGFVLIPLFDAPGAAAGFVFGGLVATFYPLRAFRRLCPLHTFNRTLRIATPCLLALVVYFTLTRWLVLNAVAAGAIFLMLMLGGLFTSGEISRQRLDSLLQLLRKQSE